MLDISSYPFRGFICWEFDETLGAFFKFLQSPELCQSRLYGKLWKLGTHTSASSTNTLFMNLGLDVRVFINFDKLRDQGPNRAYMIYTKSAAYGKKDLHKSGGERGGLFTSDGIMTPLRA